MVILCFFLLQASSSRITVHLNKQTQLVFWSAACCILADKINSPSFLTSFWMQRRTTGSSKSCVFNDTVNLVLSIFFCRMIPITSRFWIVNTLKYPLEVDQTAFQWQNSFAYPNWKKDFNWKMTQSRGNLISSLT